jgi:hypothetical protein
VRQASESNYKFLPSVASWLSPPAARHQRTSPSLPEINVARAVKSKMLDDETVKGTQKATDISMSTTADTPSHISFMSTMSLDTTVRTPGQPLPPVKTPVGKKTNLRPMSREGMLPSKSVGQLPDKSSPSKDNAATRNQSLPAIKKGKATHAPISPTSRPDEIAAKVQARNDRFKRENDALAKENARLMKLREAALLRRS